MCGWLAAVWVVAIKNAFIWGVGSVLADYVLYRLASMLVDDIMHVCALTV